LDDSIKYLNTDLDLASAGDLTALTEAFNASGAFPLHLTHDDDGLWHATIEVNQDADDVKPCEPDLHIGAMLAIVESFGELLRADWSTCTLREFNIGYNCGKRPWAFNQGLSSRIIERIAAVGASIRITIYPESSEFAG
jgi:hypothetical protein